MHLCSRGWWGRYINRRRQRMASKYIIGIILYLTTQAKHYFSKNAGLLPPAQRKEIAGHYVYYSYTPTCVTSTDYMIRASHFSGYVRGDFFFSILSSFFFISCLLALQQNTCTNWIGTRRVFTFSGIVPSKSQQSDRWLTPTAGVRPTAAFAVPHRRRRQLSYNTSRYYETRLNSAPYSCCSRDGPYNIVPWSVAGPYTGLMSRSFVKWKKIMHYSPRPQNSILLFLFLPTYTYC